MNLPTHHYPNLDLLRSVAVICVVITHVTALPIAPILGKFGVLVLFVHTSLVLMMSLDRDYTSDPSKPLFFPFMIRRCFRIYPLAICAVVAAFAFNLPVAGTESGFPDRTLSAFFSIISLVQNFTRKTSAPLVLWSLPYEMQMYLFLPALFLFCRRIASIFPLIGIAISAMTFEYFRTRYFHEVKDFVYFVPMFMAGVIAFRLVKSGSQPILSWKLWPFMVGIALLAFILLNKHLLVADAALMTDAAAALLIGAAIPCFRQIPDGLVARWCEQVAKYSYGIYLAHMFLCIWFCFLPLDSSIMAVRFFIFLSLLVVLPILSFRMIEQPMIRLGVRLANNVRFRGEKRQSLSARAAG